MNFTYEESSVKEFLNKETDFSAKKKYGMISYKQTSFHSCIKCKLLFLNNAENFERSF